MSANQAVTLFYQEIGDQEVRGKLLCLEKQMHKVMSDAASLTVEAGRILHSAQEVLANNKNGTFLRWVETCFGTSRSSAYRMIAAYERFKDTEPSVVARIEPTALYRLAETDTPQKAVTQAIRMAESGTFVSTAAAKEIINKAKPKRDIVPPVGKHSDTEPAEDSDSEPPSPSENGAQHAIEREQQDGRRLDRSCRNCALHDVAVNWWLGEDQDIRCARCGCDLNGREPQQVDVAAKSLSDRIASISAEVAKYLAAIDEFMDENGSHESGELAIEHLREAVIALNDWQHSTLRRRR